MLIPNIIIPFDGLHSAIPSNWVRDTRFDGKYVKAASSGYGDTGGNATHTHTSNSHTHSYTTNSHTHTTGTIGSATNVVKTNAQHQDAPPQDVSPQTHTHSSQTSGVMASTSITSAVASIGNANNEYSRYHFIFIKSDSYNFIPSGGIILRDDTDTRENGVHFDAADARYMKGAATGQDAGNATDVATHNHSQSHSHTLTHGHGSVNSGNAIGLIGGKDIPSSSPGNHSHTVNFTNNQEVVNNTTNIPSYTNDLAYKEFHFWKFSSQTLPAVGDIAILIDGDVPVGWEDLGLNDVYIRGKAEGEALATGGSLTHSHSNLNHSHTASSHTHPWSTSSVGGSNAYRDGGSTDIVGSHTHSGTTSANTGSNTGSTNLDTSNENHEPEYIKVRFIKMNFLSIGGSALFALA